MNMNGCLRRSLPIAVLAFLFLFFVSCGPQLGWGVVLWGENENGLPSTSVVPVHIKSKITKTYVVSRADGKGNVELPVWKVALFESKAKASSYANELLPNAPLYAVALKDGLPIREKPENTSKRVYRLRDKQLIKLLKKVDGAVVSSGKEPLKGDWFEVLTDDGVLGYSFSYYLSIFDETKGSADGAGPEAPDTAIDVLFVKTWRPTSFQTMITEQKFNLDVFTQKYGLFSDATQRQIRVELPGKSMVFNYENITKLRQNTFGFDGSGLEIRIRGADSISASWVDEGGEKMTQVFSVLKEDIQDVVRKEQARRQAMLEAIIARSSICTSETYGTLTLTRARRFSWTGYGRLSPDVIPDGAGDIGTVSFDTYFGDGFDPGYDGIMTFHFDAMPVGDTIKFLFSQDETGLRLEYLPRSGIDGIEAVKRGTDSPIAVFNKREK